MKGGVEMGMRVIGMGGVIFVEEGRRGVEGEGGIEVWDRVKEVGGGGTRMLV